MLSSIGACAALIAVGGGLFELFQFCGGLRHARRVFTDYAVIVALIVIAEHIIK